jgi:hypothetical protein
MASQYFYSELLPAILFAISGGVTVIAYLLGLLGVGAKDRGVAVKPVAAAPRRSETALAPVVPLHTVARAKREEAGRPTVAAGAIVTPGSKPLSPADFGDAFDDEPTRIVDGARRVRARTA